MRHPSRTGARAQRSKRFLLFAMVLADLLLKGAIFGGLIYVGLVLTGWL